MIKRRKKTSSSGGKKICLLCGDEKLIKSGNKSNLLVTAQQVLDGLSYLQKKMPKKESRKILKYNDSINVLSNATSDRDGNSAHVCHFLPAPWTC